MAKKSGIWSLRDGETEKWEGERIFLIFRTLSSLIFRPGASLSNEFFCRESLVDSILPDVSDFFMPQCGFPDFDVVSMTFDSSVNHDSWHDPIDSYLFVYLSVNLCEDRISFKVTFNKSFLMDPFIQNQYTSKPLRFLFKLCFNHSFHSKTLGITCPKQKP